MQIITGSRFPFDADTVGAEFVGELADAAAGISSDGETVAAEVFSLKVDGVVLRREDLVSDIAEGATVELVEVSGYTWPSADEPEAPADEPEPEAPADPLGEGDAGGE